MGRLADVLGKVGDRAFGTPQERERRRQLDSDIKRREREAYNKSYAEARVRRAQREGREKGAKGGFGFGTVSRYAESFSKAGEEFFGLPKPKAPRLHRHRRKRR